MNRQKKSFSFPLEDLNSVKRRMLHWANQCNILLFLDSNEYQHTDGAYECLCAIGVTQQFTAIDHTFSAIQKHYKQNPDWLFGHINYDFKNQLAPLTSKHPAHFAFPDVHFFQPQIVCYIRRGTNQLSIESLTESPEDIWQQIQAIDTTSSAIQQTPIQFKKRIGHDAYIDIIQQLKKHIVDGDCYEINFCNENYAEQVEIDPLAAFLALNKISPAPFAAYYKLNNQYLACASPERFINKKGQKITAQPIKGTAKRMADKLLDQIVKEQLRQSTKERAENVMIVDLMRNDLARFCSLNSVTVDELFGIYSFPQVHQMISSISGQLSNDKTLFDALALSFPMGSMTGAPKIMVMQLIEQFEASRRELYSGCVGYISPEGDFDFNVVIRSLCYNADSQYLSYHTGGAITFDSDPEQEWQETLVKSSALDKLFNN